MAKTRFFRVALEGATTDGRQIERQWLTDAAETYNPETYTARVNMEHIRGFSPEAPFNGYGSIVALKTEEVTVKLGGKDVKRLALFAQIDANDQLVAINRKGQKLFSSIEIAPEFAGTGKAYLVGLAVTDSPASLGTEMLQFAAKQGDNSPLAHRKQDKANLFTAAEEVSIEIEEAKSVDPDPTGIFASIKGMLDKMTGQSGGQQAQQHAQEQQQEEPNAPQADGNALAAFGVMIGQLSTAVQASTRETREQVTKLTADLAALTTKVEAAPAGTFTQRELALGGGENAVRTDC
ncbi:GPO family capsid scaffolding protein [Novosphingobium sp. KN65.2]|uniref:GPO family capsid scaffolding protein n=1 Tax=Novosphingobium sp. KN65.2 TaxID=1478134 RepID=UPI0005E44180|nr:GPO family capsid scaffolding protein [Novosphingobium sp. KN65.2]CDO35838.1 putative capsid scafolding protein [Novosphingobium sp. KN65.2]